MTFFRSPVSRRAVAASVLALTAGGLLPMTAGAQQAAFPTKPVRIITPFPVGGGPDGVARLVADKLSRAWGQPVVVENRPGGNGFIAIDAFKRGAKDGHDIIVLDNVHLAAYPALFKKLPYDTGKDFDALLPLFKTYFFFTVATNSKYKTIGDLIADAKANPGKLAALHLGGHRRTGLCAWQQCHRRTAAAREQAPLSGRGGACARSRIPRRAYRRRIGRSQGLRGDRLERHCGAQGPACCSHREDQARHRKGTGRTRCAGKVQELRL
jgi:hypothetical protein